MGSILLPWNEVNAYRACIGPDKGRPQLPVRCEFCDGEQLWFNGWRLVFTVVLVDGSAQRLDEGLPLQRVKCGGCGHSWTLRPAFLYPHRSFEPDVNEAAIGAYLSAPDATYKEIAARFGCSPRALWGWVAWLAALVSPAALLAEVARIDPGTPAASLIPQRVPQDHPKAHSKARMATLLRAFQVLAAVGLYHHVQLHPPDDSSPLRFFLSARFLTFRQRAFVTRASFSPPLPEAPCGPSG